MAKFGDLINAKIPVLINFFAYQDNPNKIPNDVLRDVAAVLGEKAKILKIDIDKNKTLADALIIKENPTFIIYKAGEMKWRQTGDQDADTLINLVQQYL